MRINWSLKEISTYFGILILITTMQFTSLSYAQSYTDLTKQEWKTYPAIGKYLNSDPPKPDQIFIVQYKTSNGIIDTFSEEHNSFKTVVNNNGSGTLYMQIPRNYPYTDVLGEGGINSFIVFVNGIQTDQFMKMSTDCFFTFSIPFNGNSQIELDSTSIMEQYPYHGDKIHDSCIPQTIFQNLHDNMNKTIPEFPFAIPVLVVSITSLIIFYRMKFR